MEHRALHHLLPWWNQGGGLPTATLSLGKMCNSIRQHYVQIWQWRSTVCNGSNWDTSSCRDEEPSSGEGKKLSAVMVSCCMRCKSPFTAFLHLPYPRRSPSSLQETPAELSPVALPTAFPVPLIQRMKYLLPLLSFSASAAIFWVFISVS